MIRVVHKQCKFLCLHVISIINNTRDVGKPKTCLVTSREGEVGMVNTDLQNAQENIPKHKWNIRRCITGEHNSNARREEGEGDQNTFMYWYWCTITEDWKFKGQSVQVAFHLFWLCLPWWLQERLNSCFVGLLVMRFQFVHIHEQFSCLIDLLQKLVLQPLTGKKHKVRVLTEAKLDHIRVIRPYDHQRKDNDRDPRQHPNTSS